jgi:hypothetical protein
MRTAATVIGILLGTFLVLLGLAVVGVIVLVVTGSNSFWSNK